MCGRLPSGAEKIRASAGAGVVFPDIIRKHLESSPEHYGGDYEGSGFSAQFNLGSSRIVQQVDVVLYGNTVASEPTFRARNGRVHSNTLVELLVRDDSPKLAQRTPPVRPSAISCPTISRSF